MAYEAGAAALYAYWGAAAAATVAGVYSAVQTSRNQAANAQAQAQAGEYNAEIAAQNASIARRNASAKEDAFRSTSVQTLAKQRAAAAESGFDSSSGSTALLLSQSADLAETDAQMIRYQGELDARGYSTQSTLDRYGASVSRDNVGRALRAGNVGAAASLLSSVTTYGRGLGVGSSSGLSGGGANAAGGVRIPSTGFGG